MDTRSLEHHFEVTSILYDKECAEVIEGQFWRDIRRCQQLSSQKWKKRPKIFRFYESLARLLSPLL
jgi:cardiolipin synthase